MDRIDSHAQLRLLAEAAQRRRTQIRMRITRVEALRRELHERMDQLEAQEILPVSYAHTLSARGMEGASAPASAGAAGSATNPPLL